MVAKEALGIAERYSSSFLSLMIKCGGNERSAMKWYISVSVYFIFAVTGCCFLKLWYVKTYKVVQSGT